MRTSRGYVADFVCVECPYCRKEIQEEWGRINDLTISDPDSGEIMECPRCKKEFIVDLED